MKQEALSIIESLKDEYDDTFSQDHLGRFTEYLRNSIGQGDITIFEAGQKYTEITDRIRGLDWRNYVPQLKSGWQA
jgi:hypothetical protein